MASKASRKNDTNDILGLLQTWKTEMMQAMDTKIEMTLKASANPQPSLPPMQPLSMMAYNHMLSQNYYNLALGGQRNPMATGNPIVAQMLPNAMYVPNISKTANIVPIHKGGSKREAKNYRPAALT